MRGDLFLNFGVVPAGETTVLTVPPGLITLERIGGPNTVLETRVVQAEIGVDVEVTFSD